MLAESGLCDAAKDISMAGALGTALMLLECSQRRRDASIWTRIPMPPGVLRIALAERVSELWLCAVGGA